MTSVSEAAQRWAGEEALRLLTRHRVPGLAVGLCDRTGPLWSAGFGVTALKAGRSVSTGTLFSLQSASKMYTATAVMCAVRDGLVDLDEALPAYLPEFTVHSRWESTPEARITLRHLLSHRSGLVHEAPRGSNYDNSDDSFEDHCASISETWLEFPVGDHYSYSNLGIDLAALVLQRVSGADFATYIDRVVLHPLGLHRTTFDIARIKADPDRAVGHSNNAPPRLRVPMLAAGGAYASVDDALRYIAFHLDGGRGILTPELLRQMYQVPDASPGQHVGYGLGIDTGVWNGRLVRNHGGGGFGFLCDLAWYPTVGVGVAVLTNSEDHPFQVHFATQLLNLVTSH
ncbi:serine hydrolase domain-containing protein [Desertihabitans aurantiacus]|uniref:serine hydrolase domain-containing protein n=1 Tax=Desertihabitans aurantiacus TaxID=2282477 RepID=UPI001300441B|nr:serine hydrolase domain-containing protein [Desertihabitans aurantiacus]